MSRVVLIGAHSLLEQQAALLLGDEALMYAPAATDLLLSRLIRTGEHPKLVVLGVYLPPTQVAELTSALRPSVPMIVVSTGDVELATALHGSAVDEVLSLDADIDEIDELFLRAARRAAEQSTRWGSPRELRDRGRIIVVTSPKGGVGKTTIATNLAVALAATQPHSTVLVDLDLQFGDAAMMLALNPTRSTTDAVAPVAARDIMVLKHALTPHSSGLLLLAAPPTPAGVDNISAAEIRGLLVRLAREFTHVVVDTSPGLSDHTLAALDEASSVVTVTTPDRTSLTRLSTELGVLRELDLLPESHQIVLNLGTRRSLYTVEQILGEPPTIVIPRRGAIARGNERGVPAVIDAPRDLGAKRMRELARRVTDSTAPSRRKEFRA